jgi:hypothetical protein
MTKCSVCDDVQVSRRGVLCSSCEAWYRGYTCALAPLSFYGEDSIFDYVVENAGNVGVLIKQTRKDGAMRWSGLSGYVRRERQKASP